MSYDEMPAGAEMDRLVAVKIMEWKEAFPGDIMHGAFCDYDGNWRWLESDGSLEPNELFQPSTNIAHAWEVVQKMKERGFFAGVRIGQNVVHCEFCDYDGDIADSKGGYAKALTAPLAICRAALLAHETKCPSGVIH